MDYDDGFAVGAADAAELDGQVFRARGGNVGAASENGLCFGERVDEEARAHTGQTMQAVVHGSHDAEVSAAAAQRPEQLLFIVAAGDNGASIKAGRRAQFPGSSAGSNPPPVPGAHAGVVGAGIGDENEFLAGRGH
jgi:hypothetical protein